jgi:hypothetical protein
VVEYHNSMAIDGDIIFGDEEGVRVWGRMWGRSADDAGGDAGGDVVGEC